MNNCLNCFGGRRQQSSGSAPVERNCLNCFRKRRQQPGPVSTELENNTPVPGPAPVEEEQHTAVSTEQENKTPVPGPAPVEEEQHTAVSTEQENNTPVPASAPTKEEVINNLKAISNPTDLEEFIRIIKRLLEELKSGRKSPKENKGKWTSIVKSGANFLKFVNDHTEKIEDKKEILSSNKSKVIAEILDKIGELHWVVGALSIAAYLMEKCHQVSANRAEAVQLLENMVDLVTTVAKIKDVIPGEHENLKNAIMGIVQGSVMCVSQIYSENIFSFFKTSVDSQSLKAMSEKLVHLYRALNLEISTTTAKCQSEMARNQSILLPVAKPFYPKYAVGIENARDEVINLLDMKSQDESTAVVIYGFGGIGKTTLATSVVAILNLNSYNFACVNLDEERSKNDLKEKQQQILLDAFPNFHGGQKIQLRDCQEGRNRLLEAFKCEKIPVFIFIDNALRSEDLIELLPEDLSDLPKRSKLLITTRRLNATDLITGPTRRPFAIKRLEKEHALKILCDDPDHHKRIKDDIEKILQICGGVPLALKIVRGHLVKMGYNADKCRQILKALEKGDNVKERKLSERLVDFVYQELEDDTQDAFLDICCFFNGWIRRHVEYVVGEQAVKSLEEAALITAFMGDKWTAMEMEMQMYITSIGPSDERLIVHDIVKARGQSMSANTRLINVDSLREAATQDEKIQHTKGIWLGKYEDDELKVEAKHLDLMSGCLRVLSIGDRRRPNGRCERTFEELRFFHGSYHEDVISKSTQLAFLHAHLMKEQRKLTINLPESLRLLYLSAPSDPPVPPDIKGHLTSLRELHLLFITLDNFETSIGNFSSLQTLEMHYCSKPLPESFGSLSSLQRLRMCGCSNLERLPESFGSLSSLQELRMDGCSNLERLPESFGSLSSLQELRMDGCSNLERLPESFGSLSSLKTLFMADSSNLERLPESFGSLSSLYTLKLNDCEKMRSLSYKFGHLKCLKFLSISNCKELTSLHDDVVGLASLAAVKAYGCTELEARSMDSLVEIKSLMFVETGESPMLIKRWKEIQQQQRPLIGAALRFEYCKYPYEEIMSTMLFNGGSRFLHVDGDERLVEVGVKVGLLLTACDDISSELRNKLMAVASSELQIIYVDVHVEAEAEAEGSSGWMEERKNRLRKTLKQLPNGSCAWTSSFRKTTLLMAYSLCHFTGSVVSTYNPLEITFHTSIVGTRVGVDEDGRRKISGPLKKIFRSDGCDSRRVDFQTVLSPLDEAWKSIWF